MTKESTAAKHSRSSIETLTSSDTMPLPTLPFDIGVEILSRLPVKLLMQFQCVCKSWKSLISDRKFAKKHLRHASQSLILTSRNPDLVLLTLPLSSVFTQVATTAIQLEYPVEIPDHDVVVIGSCHGILCFHLSGLVYLWNPSIRKLTILPYLEYRTPHDFSFGYDHFSDTYKVVAASREPIVIDGMVSDFETQVSVHTLGTTCWTRILDIFPPHTLIMEKPGKFDSGAIHWVTYKETHSSWVIVSLDLEKEFYRELPQPDYGGINMLTLSSGVLRDCFCIFSNADKFSDVWLMKEYGNKDSWTKLFRLPYVGDHGSWPYVCALNVSQDDQLLFYFATTINKKELVVYNSRDGTWKDPGIQNIDKWMNSEVYRESLISPCF